ncbi:hypothetical protein E2P81_ATG06625 [Venturia nashicola]|uniref:Uncharacterized protein n=1 Tax=Venturia nashicola TaxID=86259 RepID=A0A4Z1P093_9PEZI|nr:hypothetical protein E6O75_ATG06794 [Venturia nashicola]TLD29972.1 hypothetical protein E2P81_ATG06625 [Venturia nashicola]
MPNHGYTQYSSDPNEWSDIDDDDDLPDDASDIDDSYSSDTDSVCSDKSDGDRNDKPPTRHGRFRGEPGTWGPFY